MLMMREALSAGLRGQRRANHLLLGPNINRSRPNGDSSWLTADQAGEVDCGCKSSMRLLVQRRTSGRV
uniref:Uncharacterized protein n=1 Tax=Streptomyces auratus AGR0001 TaxID=1160718 RepID=J1ZU03_9ACTN